MKNLVYVYSVCKKRRRDAENTDDVVQLVALSQHARTSGHVSLSTENFVKAVSVPVCFILQNLEEVCVSDLENV
jgi:hypothetical protein